MSKIEEIRKKRTKKNFSEYKVEVIKHGDDVLIHRFAKPDTRCGSVTFINAEGILAVTGDYGNWIFCREFYPSKDGYVSDGYWLEKLRISSTQKPCDFDADLTRQEIESQMAEEDIDEEDKAYLENLLGYLDEGEERYLVYAHDNLPRNRDHEYVPISKRLNPWLEVIFDTFDEICRRMETEETPPKGISDGLPSGTPKDKLN